jgi:hypothetical protein
MSSMPVSQVFAGGLHEFRIFDMPRHAVTVLTRDEREVENHLPRSILGQASLSSSRRLKSSRQAESSMATRLRFW